MDPVSVAITRDRQARTLSMSQELYVTDLITKLPGSSTTSYFAYSMPTPPLV